MTHIENKDSLHPSQKLFRLIFSKIITQCIGVAAELGIADLLKDGSCSIEKLAQKSKVKENYLYRVMRALVSVGIFKETEPEIFALNDLAEPLCSNSPHSLKDFAAFVAHPVHNGAHSALLHSVKTGETGFDYVHRTDSFSYMKNDTDFFNIFNLAMTSLSHRDAQVVSNAYDFSGFSRLVDIGGGNGFLLAEILKTTPELKGVLFDLQDVISNSQSIFKKFDLLDRVKFISGDFFNSVPSGADAYIMKYVLHDWDDEQASLILKNCALSKNSGGKILIIDNVIPEGDNPHLGKLHDIEMMVMTGGRERTASEFEALLNSAGLNLINITPTESTLSIVEAE